MNTGLKIGLSVLIAVLLVISAVGITLAVTGGGAAKQGNTVAYQSGNPATEQYAGGPYCYYNNRAGNSSYGPRYGGCPGWRWGDRD